MLRKIPKKWRIVLLNGVLVLLVLLAVEGLARLAYTNRFLYEGNQFSFFEYDAELGWRGQPDVKGPFTRGEEFDTVVVHNPDGYRTPVLAAQKPLNEFRIAVLGDSFAWGFGVNNDQTFSAVLERQLGDGYSVVNFGVSGYGRGQQWLQLQRDVSRVQPDAVIVMAYPGNDLYDNVADNPRIELYPRPRFEVEPTGQLSIRGLPVPRVDGDFTERMFMRYAAEWTGIYQRSYLFRMLFHLVTDIEKEWQGSASHHLFSEIYLPENREKMQAQMELERTILTNMKHYLDARCVPMLYAVGSTAEQLLPALQAQIAATLDRHDLDWRQPSRFLLQAAREAGIETLDLEPPLAELEQRGLPVHFNRDFHWNERGQHAVGTALAPWVRQMHQQILFSLLDDRLDKPAQTCILTSGLGSTPAL